jgi:hypothetical protein
MHSIPTDSIYDKVRKYYVEQNNNNYDLESFWNWMKIEFNASLTGELRNPQVTFDDEDGYTLFRLMFL